MPYVLSLISVAVTNLIQDVKGKILIQNEADILSRLKDNGTAI